MTTKNKRKAPAVPVYHTPKSLAAVAGVTGQTVLNLVQRGVLAPDATTEVGGLLFLPRAVETIHQHYQART